MKYELESCEECGSKNVEMQVDMRKGDCFVLCFNCGNAGRHFENEMDAAIDWNGGFAVGYVEPERQQKHED